MVKKFRDLNEHAALKDRTIKEDHVPYMNSDLRKQMYKRNMLKNRHLKDRSNPIKWLLYRQQRNNVTGMRRKPIRDVLCPNVSLEHQPKIFGMQ